MQQGSNHGFSLGGPDSLAVMTALQICCYKAWMWILFFRMGSATSGLAYVSDREFHYTGKRL